MLRVRVRVRVSVRVKIVRVSSSILPYCRSAGSVRSGLIQTISVQLQTVALYLAQCYDLLLLLSTYRNQKMNELAIDKFVAVHMTIT